MTDNVFPISDELVELGKLAMNGMEDTARGDGLPPIPIELKAMPAMLGKVQDYIFGTMSYPSLELAGFVSMLGPTMVVAPNLTITSEDGLGFNEFYGVAGNTTVGKERLVKAIKKLIASSGVHVNMDSAMSASPQALHRTLEKTDHVFIFSDECGDWFRLANNDGHKQALLSYLMQVYSKAVNGDIHPGKSITNEYQTVYNPRVSIFGTSTPSAFFGSFTPERARAGAYNRWNFFVCETDQMEKDYSAKSYEPPQDIVEWFGWMGGLADGFEGPVKFPEYGSADHDRYIELDKHFAEDLRDKGDPLKSNLGGRVGEQAIKMAGLVALANQRMTITADDLEFAFRLRRGLYERTKASVEMHGSLEGGKSLATTMSKKIAELMMKHREINKSHLRPRLGDKWDDLDPWMQDRVIKGLEFDNILKIGENQRGNPKLVSKIYQPKS